MNNTNTNIDNTTSKKAVISFGKRAYANPKRRANLVELELELRYKNKGPVFTVCGTVWNALHTDAIMGGQCIDTIAERLPILTKNTRFNAIRRLWKLHHLNDMHAGTEKQERIIADYTAAHPGEYVNYDHAVRILRDAGAYIDDGYEYGTKWLYRPIPDEDLAEINAIIDGAKKTA